MTFYELEKKCKRKRLKKYLLLFVFFLVIVSIGIYYFIYLNNKKFENIAYEINQTKEKNQTKKFFKNKIIDHNFTKVKIKKETNVSNEKNFSKDKNNSLKSPKIKQLKSSEINHSISKNIQKNESNKTSIRKDANITQNNKQKIVLQTVTLPSYETCISLAEKYLKNKEYQKALKWAKYANIQNREDAKSWIISAKSLYLMGQKEEAIKLLKVYNSYYKNKEVEKLLKEFNSE